MAPKETKLSPAGWIAIIIMVGLLIVSAIYAINIWTSVNTSMSGFGWGMLILGIVVTTAVGAGLMFLVFYSARHDMDR